MWACERWKGRLYTRQAPRELWLRQYSQVFNTVEGNSVFYHLPALETVRRWADSVAAGFRFAFKFPRVITHEKRLLNATAETRALLERLDVLHAAGRLGTCWLQLPPGFAPHQLKDLQSYLSTLPQSTVVCRRASAPGVLSLGAGGAGAERGVAGGVGEPRDSGQPAAVQRPPAGSDRGRIAGGKPRLPVSYAVTGAHPLVRVIGRNDIQQTLPWLREWAARLARWIEMGLRPFVFTHTPDELHAPRLARAFHDELRRHTNVLDELPPWPGERERNAGQQLELF